MHNMKPREPELHPRSSHRGLRIGVGRPTSRTHAAEFAPGTPARRSHRTRQFTGTPRDGYNHAPPGT